MSASTDIQNAAAAVSAVQAFITQGDAQATDSNAITYYQSAATVAARAAVLASNAVQILVNTNPNSYELAIAAFNASEATTDNLNDTYGYDSATAKAQIRTSAENALTTLNLVITYANEVQSGTSITPNASGAAQSTLDSAIALKSSLSSGCNCSTDQANVTLAFQNAFDSDVSSGKITGTFIIPDAGGKYGYGTAHALGLVLGSTPPSPCWGSGNACFGKLAGSPTVSEQLTPNTTPQQPVPTTQGAGPWLASLGIAGSIWYAVTKKPFGFDPFHDPARKLMTLTGGALATAAAFAFWPLSPVVAVPVQGPVSPVSTLTNGQTYTVTLAFNTQLDQSFVLLNLQGLGWKIKNVVYMPGTTGQTWPTNIVTLPVPPPGGDTMVFIGVWNEETGTAVNVNTVGQAFQ
jgi:hypothetical protein